MKRHLLYVASPNQMQKARQTIEVLKPIKKDKYKDIEYFVINSPLLGKIQLHVYLLTEIEAVAYYLKQTPIDLLVYDERHSSLDAIKAIELIESDVESLASSWGNDFHFPMKRVLAIIGQRDKATSDAFKLGKHQIQGVLIDPKSVDQTLKWIAKQLDQDYQKFGHKTGVALSGGGLEGCLYQVGTVYALEQALNGRGIQDAEIYSGVSSGSIIATMLANKVPSIEVIKSFKGVSETIPPFTSNVLYDLAGKDIFRRMSQQMLSVKSLSPTQWAQKAMRSIPTGFFKGDSLVEYLRNAIETYGVDDSFTRLSSKLFIGATDQDSFSHVVFGQPPLDKVPISDAVRASCALPPVFTPHQILGRSYIDGQITKTCNLELVVKQGCGLIFIIDPIIPYGKNASGTTDELGGIYTVIQTVKTLVHTRFRYVLNHLSERFPHVDFIIFQPYGHCAKVMSGSPMKYKINTQIIDLAYTNVLQKLINRHHVYLEKLAKFGFELKNVHELKVLAKQGILL